MKYSFLTSWQWNFCCVHSHNECNIKQEGKSVWKKLFLPGNSQITTSKVNCKMTVTFNVAIIVLPSVLLLTQSQRFLEFSQLACKLVWETSWSALFFLCSELLATEGTHLKHLNQALGGNAFAPKPWLRAQSWDHNISPNSPAIKLTMWPSEIKEKSVGQGSGIALFSPHEKWQN